MDHPKSTSVAQVSIESVRLGGIELHGQERDGGDRRELAGRTGLAGEELAKQPERRGAGGRQGVGTNGRPLYADEQFPVQNVRERE